MSEIQSVMFELNAKFNELINLNKELDKTSAKLKKVGFNKSSEKLVKKYQQMKAQIARTGKETEKLNRQVSTQVKLFKQARAVESMMRFEQGTKGLVGVWNKLSDSTLRFNGNLLSMLFFGMAIKNVFTSALKSIFEGYSKIMPEGSEFNQLTSKLSANWQFFKFQLADALASSPIFKALIDNAIDLIQKFQGLSKETKTWIVIGMGIFVIIGALLMFIGVVGLGLASLTNIAIGFGALKLIGTGAMGGLTTATIKWLTALAPVVGWLLLIGAAIAVLYKINSKHLDNMGLEVTGTWNNIKSVAVTFAAGIVNIFILLISTIIGLFIGLGGAVKIVFDSILELAKQLASAIWSAIKAGFTGGDPLKAFVDTWDFDAVKQKVKDGFTFTTDALGGLSIIASEATKTVNAWEVDKQIKWANAIQKTTDSMKSVSDNDMSDIRTTYEAMLADTPVAAEQPTSAGTQNNVVNININDTSLASGSVAGGAINKFLEDFSNQTGIQNPAGAGYGN